MYYGKPYFENKVYQGPRNGKLYCEINSVTKIKRCYRNEAAKGKVEVAKGKVEVAFVVENLICLGMESVHLQIKK